MINKRNKIKTKAPPEQNVSNKKCSLVKLLLVEWIEKYKI